MDAEAGRQIKRVSSFLVTGLTSSSGGDSGAVSDTALSEGVPDSQ